LRHQYFAEGLRYHVPGRSPVAGDYEGAAQVVEFSGRLFELSGGTFRVELHDVVANDQHAVALFNVRAERAGKKLAENTVLESHVRDGRVTEARIIKLTCMPWMSSGRNSQAPERSLLGTSETCAARLEGRSQRVIATLHDLRLGRRDEVVVDGSKAVVRGGGR
jgi:ketosteroid isomerase-like protein